MLIRKKPPRPHAPHEPLLHENHRRPVTRRELLGAGFLGASGLVMAPAWLAALVKPGRADAAIGLAPDVSTLATGTAADGTVQCAMSQGAGLIPFICFDLAGGANLVGSEVIVGVQGGQANFLSTAGYGKMGVPGNMVPTAAGFVSSALGLLWHSDGAILRGILSKATSPATAAGTNGAVFPALSENDTNINPHNPMYGIATVGANGSLLTLVGTEPTVSGGNSMAPPNLGGVAINSALQPSTIDRPRDATGLVSTGGASADQLSVAVQESQLRISGGSTPYSATASDPASAFTGVLTEPNTGTSTPGVQLYTTAATDAQLKGQVRCNYVKAAYNAANYGNPSDLDPTQDSFITGGGTPIFTAADFSDSDVAMTATVMKLVLNGFAGAGTISLGGFDYHDNTRATGETRNFRAGQMIGAVLEYAQRLQKPVMIYVFSDGSLTSSSMVDTTPAGRDKLAWQGDSSAVASTFFLLYNPKGRTAPLTAGSQQVGYFSSDGSVVSTSSPGANSVVQLVEMVVLNYLSLHTNLVGQFATKFPQQGLGSPSDQQSLIAFPPIV
ncbi:MAG TPA: hypothetical protein VN735_01555 [Steroidobacteraceae bacterium]|nr:hypothetical protein [Steroidobacteraceae bacterium]